MTVPTMAEFMERIAQLPELPFGDFLGRREECPDGPHRGPEGPNEDLSQCPRCLMPSWGWRPEGEEFGGHIEDCSLPRRHESYCVPGGAGHPDPTVRRG